MTKTGPISRRDVSSALLALGALTAGCVPESRVDDASSRATTVPSAASRQHGAGATECACSARRFRAASDRAPASAVRSGHRQRRSCGIHLGASRRLRAQSGS
jgi:hypothetical protein